MNDGHLVRPLDRWSRGRLAPICEPADVEGRANMSRERTSVIGIIVLTTCITAAVLATGWYAASRYFGQQTVGAAHEDAPAPPAPRGKTPRAAENDSARRGTRRRETPQNTTRGRSP